MITIRVDGRDMEVQEETNLLQACLDNGIYIPNLCFLEDMEAPPTSCRMCLVEVGDQDQPVPACTVRVTQGMTVRTDTARVRRLQRSALQLLLSAHDVDCAHCPANRRCSLQDIARFLKVGLKPKGLEPLRRQDVAQGHPYIHYHPNRCILCGKCLYVCERAHARPFLTFAKRGFDTVVSFFGEEKADELPCQEGFLCVEICPVAALTLKIPREEDGSDYSRRV